MIEPEVSSVTCFRFPFSVLAASRSEHVSKRWWQGKRDIARTHLSWRRCWKTCTIRVMLDQAIRSKKSTNRTYALLQRWGDSPPVQKEEIRALWHINFINSTLISGIGHTATASRVWRAPARWPSLGVIWLGSECRRSSNRSIFFVCGQRRMSEFTIMNDGPFSVTLKVSALELTS